jgi:hypothetical protein
MVLLVRVCVFYLGKLYSGRHAFAATPKLAQSLARHSDVNLTMSRHTHVDLHNQAAAPQRAHSGGDSSRGEGSGAAEGPETPKPRSGRGFDKYTWQGSNLQPSVP